MTDKQSIFGISELKYLSRFSLMTSISRFPKGNLSKISEVSFIFPILKVTLTFLNYRDSGLIFLNIDQDKPSLIFLITDKLDSVWEEIQNYPRNVMFRQNQYWIIVAKSKDNFEKAVQNSDIPIDSNVLLCVRRGFLSEIVTKNRNIIFLNSLRNELFIQ